MQDKQNSDPVVDRGSRRGNTEEKTPDAPSMPQERAWLAESRGRAAEEQRVWQSREWGWSWGRVGSFVAIVMAWFVGIPKVEFEFGLCVPAIVAFIWTVRRHGKARRHREQADRLLLMIDESESRLGGKVVTIRTAERPTDAKDPGAKVWHDARDLDKAEQGATWTLTDQEISDLDFYAEPVGVFGLLNRTSTAIGARRLREVLEHPLLAGERILERQATVHALDGAAEPRLRLLAICAQLRRLDDELDQFIARIATAPPLPERLASVGLRCWGWLSGLFTVVALGFVAMGQLGWGYAWMAMFLLNATAYWNMRPALQKLIVPWRGTSRIARACARTFGAALPVLEEIDELHDTQRAFTAAMTPTALPGLARIVGWADSSGIFQEMCNAAFFLDLHIVHRLTKHVVPHREELRAAFAQLAELEMFLSLGTFAYEQPIACYPQLATQRELAMRGSVHALLDPGRAVSNDVHLAHPLRLWIVTGSNMAGKSTLLRVVGTNVVLAQIGSVVTAEAMTWTPARIMSDLSVRDDLNRAESYFLAEVRHLARMLESDSEFDPAQPATADYDAIAPAAPHDPPTGNLKTRRPPCWA
jgi:hypothetical protein